MASYQIKHYLPKGEPDREWIARTYSRVLKCSEAAKTSEGQTKTDFESELKVLNRALAACDVSIERAEEEYQIYRRTRTMKRAAGAEAAQKAMSEF